MQISTKKETIQAPFEAVAQLTEEVSVKTSEEGMNITTMDPANVAMAIVKIPKAAFTKYKAGQEFSVNMESFMAMLKKMKDELNLEIKDNRLFMKDEVKEYELGLLDEEETPEQKLPELKFTTELDGNKDFTKAVNNLGIIGEAIRFSFKGQNLFMSCEGKFSAGKFTTTMKGPLGENKDFSKYSHEYLAKMLKPLNGTTKHFKIRFGKEYPLMLDYKLLNDTSIKYILAPRIDNMD